MSSATTSLLTDHPPEKPVVGVTIDGNTATVALVSMTPKGSARVHHVSSIEANVLVEHVGRAVHPIFMDVDFIEFPESELLRSILSELINSELRQYPVVATFPGESTHDLLDEAVRAGLTTEARFLSAIERTQSANPYAYPRIVGGVPVPPEMGGGVWLWWARFDDVLALAANFRGLPFAFAGAVSGKRALSEISGLLARQNPQQPITVIDLGKMRTVYAGRLGKRKMFTYAIPVGLARDDVHYFSSIPLNTSRLFAMGAEAGPLLFPPDMTPSPVFESGISTPQVDCTRFGTQVARYAHRVLHDTWRGITRPENVAMYLSGLPSHLPGLREFVEGRLERSVRRLDLNEMAGLSADSDVSSQAVSNALPSIGAALAFHRRSLSRFGMILRDRRPKQLDLRGEDLDSGRLTLENPYIIEKPTQQKRRPT